MILNYNFFFFEVYHGWSVELYAPPLLQTYIYLYESKRVDTLKKHSLAYYSIGTPGIFIRNVFAYAQLILLFVKYTVVGRQSGRELRSYSTEAGEELLILHPGIRSAHDIFRSEHNSNRTSTWIYRLAGKQK